MRQRGLLSRGVHLLAGALAVLGLNGHGIAMLLVAVALPGNAAAQHDLSSRIEICSPQGLTADAPPSAGTAGQPRNGALPPSERRSAGFDGCTVCTAFAQSGAADLPRTAASFEFDCCTASWQAERAPALPATARLRLQTRGPPRVA